ncbi:MAG: hypothetical protein LUI12_13995 [Clostridiales bacterium]|nr:hypothetical protein [Clostridiales bacterium]
MKIDKIIFLSDKTEYVYNVNLSKVSEHVLKIIFADTDEIPSQEIILSGFNVLNEYNGKVQGQYPNHTSLFRNYTSDDELEVYELSNDGSVYTEPEPTPETEPVVYVPTLEEVKSSKIYELSSECNMMIINGVDVDIDGKTEHFTYGIESGDQGNIDDLFNLAVSTGLSQPYHCDDGNCKLYTVEQIVQLYLAQKVNKTHHTTYFNQLKKYINDMEDTDSEETSVSDTVSNIIYGDELTGEYLETYNTMMAQAQLIINSILEQAGVSANTGE